MTPRFVLETWNKACHVGGRFNIIARREPSKTLFWFPTGIPPNSQNKVVTATISMTLWDRKLLLKYNKRHWKLTRVVRKQQESESRHVAAGEGPFFSWKTTSSHLHVIADQKCMTVLKKRKDYSAAVVLCYMRIQGSHRQCHSIEHHNVKYSASSQEHFKIVSSYIKFGVLFCKYWIPPHTRWVLSFIVKQNRIFEWKFNMHTHAHQNGHQYSWAQSSKNCSTHILTELSYLQPVIIL